MSFLIRLVATVCLLGTGVASQGTERSGEPTQSKVEKAAFGEWQPALRKATTPQSTIRTVSNEEPDEAVGRVSLQLSDFRTDRPVPVATPQRLPLIRPKAPELIDPGLSVKTSTSARAPALLQRRRARPSVRTVSGSKPKRRQASAAPSRSERTRMIASRRQQTGFKGFCPVELRNNRRLVNSLLSYGATYQSRTYYFSSAAALNTFRSHPARYVAAAGGRDVVLLCGGGPTSGRLDHATWYRGRLYLFSTARTLRVFQADPARFATD